ncbi:class III extradiol dioxygenase subunit beta [Paraburkholderia sp. SOS3]|jgi:protocatechuate 4,5-dioxygenase beta chain|uniref:class III extradiol dioxygenase subunit beta n=1 Tax=Paraburkholderia sp. SOS3 TaxID=1926494 RepID=UPI0009475A6B|nr:class III extradiol dioxygenase subunit beta [Paraburkholderia sp. SOS3]APR38377.1 protocatechuate 3,4-dioxygenase [Paraburkholderia sp. SOS3]
MARIVGGVATSHVPSIGAAIDHGKIHDSYWHPLFEGVQPARKWIEDVKPDVAIVVYNDHASRFGLDMTPTFAIGMGAQFAPHDEGYGPRPVPVCQGEPEFAWHLVESLVLKEEFDIAMVGEMTVDHGLTVPLSLMFGQPRSWPCRVIPLCVNVIQYPQPTALRCFRLGQALRRAIDSYERDLKVVICGTGGMSHQLQGERAGLINAEYDRMWLDRMEDDPQSLCRITHTELLREAGSEGLEIIMWLVMRGALDPEVRRIHRFYHVPASNTAYGMLVLEGA